MMTANKLGSLIQTTSGTGWVGMPDRQPKGFLMNWGTVQFQECGLYFDRTRIGHTPRDASVVAARPG